jgi:hypothetical protein
VTAILMGAFGRAMRRCTSGWTVEVFGRGIVSRGIGTRQEGGVGGLYGIWMRVRLESGVMGGRRAKGEGGRGRKNSRCTHTGENGVVRVCIAITGRG